METRFDWVKARVAEAKQAYPLITESVSTGVEKLVTGSFSERQLPAGELTTIAKNLIAEMVPAQQDAEAEQ